MTAPTYWPSRFRPTRRARHWLRILVRKSCWIKWTSAKHSFPPSYNCAKNAQPQHRELLVVFFPLNHLSKVPLRVSRTLIFAALIVLLDGIQDSLNGTTASGTLADLELAG